LKRYATTSALAASAVTSLVMARGHKVSNIPEVPLVVDTKTLAAVDTTKKAVALLKGLGAYEDVEKAKESKSLRAGRGKMRNRRFTQRLGPLVVYNEKGTIERAFRNLPGVELVNVNRLNFLRLAPGGHLGRFIIWTKDAFEQLDNIFGTYKRVGTQKVGYQLPRSMIANADVTKLMNSSEIQSALRPKGPAKSIAQHRRNPLKNLNFMVRLNPHALTEKRTKLLALERQNKAKKEAVQAKRTGVKKAAPKPKTASKKYVATLLSK
jgi:large subunit ribosomal protein L4e